MTALAFQRQAERAAQRWLGLPAERLGCLLHFMAVAVTLAAAKVMLNTIGAARFLAKEGPGQLPLFYLLLAAAAILLSAASSGVIDRVPRIRLGQATFLGTLLVAAALRYAIWLQVPGAYYALLASAHIYEIVLEIVFWLVVATFLDTIELKRCTPFLNMALAAGGALGGALMSGLSPIVRSEDLLLALPLLGVLAAAQFEFARRRLPELPDPDHARIGAGSVRDDLRLLPRLTARYPLILVIALSALLLTVLYGLTEYLVFTAYADAFPDEAKLTQFLAIVFAVIQVLEFGLLYVVSRPLLERARPLVRNLVFPTTSLACLIAFTAGHRLAAAIVTHLNIEAVSNAIFQPVYHTNYLALPLRFHGRIRTLADGVFYPAGLALAGAMLLTLQPRLAPEQLDFVAITFALVFIVLNVGAGVLFLPALVRNLRADLPHFAEAAPAGAAPAAMLPEQIGGLLRSADPETRSIGLGLAGRVDPAPFLAELYALAPAADRPTRRAIASLLARAASGRLGQLLDELLDSDDPSSQLIALQAKLARGDAFTPHQLERLIGSSDRSVAAVAALAAGASGRRAEVARSCRDPKVAADVLDACAQAKRSELADLLIEVIEAAPLEQQREGVAVLRAIVDPRHLAAAALGRRFAHYSDAQLRAEALGLLGALAGSTGVLEALGEALGDPSRLVRERAADALAAQGDAAIEVAVAGLGADDPDRVEAVIRSLGRIGSRRAREALSALPQPICRDVARNLGWLRQLRCVPERARWLALELALEDHNRRIVSLVLDVLAALGEGRLVAQLRHALAAPDQRTRANALEALLALPQRRLLQPILPLLDTRYAIGNSVALPAASSAELATILAAAGCADDRWIRIGAAWTARALGSTAPGAQQNLPAPAQRSMVARSPVTPTELDMERILLLKRVPLFRYLPLDTLLAVGRVLERRHYIDGETILQADARWDHFCLIETGGVDLLAPDSGIEHLVAPAHFGELVLVEEHLRSPKVVAVGDCTLLRLHRIVFHDLSRDHPDMLMELCKLLARRLRRAEEGARS